MATWKGEFIVSVLGFAGLSLGTFELHKLKAKQIQTELICPECQVKVESIPISERYRCPKCQRKFKSWYQLKRAVKSGDGYIPIPPKKTEKTAKAELKLLDLSEVRGLVTKEEYVVIPRDEGSRRNLQKIGAMLLRHNKVALFKLCFRKGGDQHIFYITVNDDGLIIARSIVPLNLVEPLPAGVVYAEENVPEQEIQELLNAMPKATEQDLILVDETIEAVAKAQPEEAQDLVKAIKQVMIKEQ